MNARIAVGIPLPCLHVVHTELPPSRRPTGPISGDRPKRHPFVLPPLPLSSFCGAARLQKVRTSFAQDASLTGCTIVALVANAKCKNLRVGHHASVDAAKGTASVRVNLGPGKLCFPARLS